MHPQCCIPTWLGVKGLLGRTYRMSLDVEKTMSFPPHGSLPDASHKLPIVLPHPSGMPPYALRGAHVRKIVTQTNASSRRDLFWAQAPFFLHPALPKRGLDLQIFDTLQALSAGKCVTCSEPSPHQKSLQSPTSKVIRRCNVRFFMEMAGPWPLESMQARWGRWGNPRLS